MKTETKTLKKLEKLLDIPIALGAITMASYVISGDYKIIALGFGVSLASIATQYGVGMQKERLDNRN